MRQPQVCDHLLFFLLRVSGCDFRLFCHQKPRDDFYTVQLAADCVTSVSSEKELRLTNRKYILGTMDTADEYVHTSNLACG